MRIRFIGQVCLLIRGICFSDRNKFLVSLSGILLSRETMEYLRPESVFVGLQWPAVAKHPIRESRVCCSCYRWSLWLLLWALTLLSAPALLFSSHWAFSLSSLSLRWRPYGEPPADMVCGGSIQVCGIQASGFQVTLADVFVPERWSACWSGARGELTIHWCP